MTTSPAHSFRTSKTVSTDQYQHPSRYANDADPVVRLAALTLDGQSAASMQSELDSLDPSSPQYASQAKRISDQEHLRSAWSDFKKLDDQLANALKMADTETDEEMKMLAEDEVEELTSSLELLRTNLSDRLFPPDDIHQSGALIELRPGIGGEESCLFVAEMTRMYERWCAANHPDWSVSLLSSTSSEFNGALKEAILQISGTGPYGSLRFEAGIHRVQRIPVTTSVPKMQSSTMTIVVLPLATETKFSSEDQLVDPRDVKTEVMRSRGAGGQHVNKTESAIRLTHIPSGITVSMQDSRSQHANREKAWSILRSRLLDIKNKEKEQHERNLRGEQIVGMGRGDRVRTYNYPQDRVTDHRIHSNANNLDQFMQGTGEALTSFIQELQNEERQKIIEYKLRSITENNNGKAQSTQRGKR
ncbi:unnamed protein product [Sympodiomycopsis kandeliae]